MNRSTRVSVGDRYSALTVVSLVVNGKNPLANCVCDCGNVVRRSRAALKAGISRSCGCLRNPWAKMHRDDLTADEVRRLLFYDPLTGVFTRKATVACRSGGAIGDIAGCAVPHKGGIQISIHSRIYRAHRLAWLYVHGKWPVGEIDHINGNNLDNRIVNLRDVSRTVNAQNIRRPKKTNKLGILGVKKCRQKWQASVFADGKINHLGSFDSPELAQNAYITAKRKLHKGCTL